MAGGRATVGVSLKMYFGHAQTLEWCERVAEIARRHPGVELFVIPDFVSVVEAVRVFEGTGVAVGAQDLSWDDSGALTGEVSGAVLAEVGVGVVEVGHAERRRIFGETPDIVASKAHAALRNGLAPVLCIGEVAEGPADVAANECLAQLAHALSGAPAGRVIVAYEPVWAIGAARPAPTGHIRAVGSRLKAAIADRVGSVVVYGGSAGPGLLTELGDDVDGVFLGRFAHDPAALEAVLVEAAR